MKWGLLVVVELEGRSGFIAWTAEDLPLSTGIIYILNLKVRLRDGQQQY